MPAKATLFALATALGLARLGYFIPYRYAGRAAVAPRRYDWLERRFAEQCGARFGAVLDDVAQYDDALRALGGRPPEPRWTQDWFPGLDGAAAYAIVRRARPRQIVEIGSGHSTRFMMKAARDGGFEVAMTCVDPAPRADLAGLGVTLLRRPVQQVDLKMLPDLAPGDILFLDSSHIAMPDSDVDWVVNRILPALPAGTLVHVHDIFLPDPYPPAWDWRGYNEQLVIAALLAGGRAQPLFSSHYVRSRAGNLIAERQLDWIAGPAGSHESSLWLELA